MSLDPEGVAKKCSGPLSGVRVLDLTINVLGPVATQILGDMGADVIKVEAPGGDPNRSTGPSRSEKMSTFYMTVNRNKRSIALDLKRPEAYAALMRLVGSADVFVHSMRPGAARRLGVAYEDIAARNPRIVYGYGPGYRSDGPKADLPAFDDVIQGESGIASMMERMYGEPRYLPTVIVDKFCGYVLASSIGMALYAREKTGLGQEVQVPMFETMVAFNLLEHLWGGAFDPPTEDGIGYIRMFSEHRRPYRTADGFICLLAVNDEQWSRLLRVLDCPHIAADPRFRETGARIRNINVLYEIVSSRMLSHTTEEWRVRLGAADIPNGPVTSFSELLTHPYLVETGFFKRFVHPTEGSLLTTDVTTRFSQTPGGLRRGAPRLGEHTEEVLLAAGFSLDEIALLQGRPVQSVA